MPHNCPNYCHSCPDMRRVIIAAGRRPQPGEDVMPFCGANANFFTGDGWREVCYCPRPVTVRSEIDRLKTEIARLESRLPQMSGKTP